MGTNRRLFGFQGIGLRGDIEPHKSIQAMASRYLEEARQIQPFGPYVLAGFCVGGHIAMEMANQLVDAGQDVQCLFLIDTPLAGPAVITAAISAQIEVARQRWIKFPETRVLLAGAPHTIAALGQALLTHLARPFSGRAQIFASEQFLPSLFDARFGWKGLLPASTAVFQIAPNHDAVLRRTPVIAKLIHEALGTANFNQVACHSSLAQVLP